MIEAQYLTTDRTAGEAIAFSPWFPKGGDKMLFFVDLTQSLNGGQIQVELYHQNTNETGNGTLAATLAYTSAIGVSQQSASDLKELVRYRYSVKLPEGTGHAHVLFRMLSPVFYDALKV
jgi:hypothetical protein